MENRLLLRLHQRSTQPAQLLLLGIAVALAAATVAWIALRADEDKASTAAGPVLVSDSQLRRLARSVDRPIFWAGPRKGYSYEVTAADARVYVRYLPSGVPAGDARARFLAIGTYSSADAAANLKLAANQRRSVSQRLHDGGFLVFAANRPTRVYVGFPAAKHQVEVFHPSDDTARRLVLDGAIVPIR